MFRSGTTYNPILGGASGFRMNMSWTSIFIYIMVIIFLIIFSIYLYKKYTTSNTTEAYKANRENVHGSKNNHAELILFTVDWCPHCKTAKPEWENLKAEYENKPINGYNIIFTEHNCTAESAEVEELMNKYKIEGYPTIKLLKDNQVIEYDAKPTKTTLEQFLNTVL